jgi:hypothetical protein
MNGTQQKPQTRKAPVEKSSGNSQARRPFAELKRFPLKVVVWENPTANGSMFSIQSPVRMYQDGNGWKETHSLNADDLLGAAKLLEQADTLIQEEMAERRRLQQQASNDRS